MRASCKTPELSAFLLRMIEYLRLSYGKMCCQYNMLQRRAGATIRENIMVENQNTREFVSPSQIMS